MEYVAKTPQYLGQKHHCMQLSLGDFGSVWANVDADLFYTRNGYSVTITSVKILLFTREIEFLHRLTDKAKERLEQHVMSDANSSLNEPTACVYDL